MKPGLSTQYQCVTLVLIQIIPTLIRVDPFNLTNEDRKMIGYVTIGTNDLERGAKFYDDLLAEIGAKRFMEEETFIAWAVAPGEPSLAISKPFDGSDATVGNGVMVALAVKTP